MKKEIDIDILLTKHKQVREMIGDNNELADEVFKLANMAYELGKKDAQVKKSQELTERKQ